MIKVIVTIDLLPNCVGEFLSILNKSLPAIRAENGCLAYVAMIDIDSQIPTQNELRQNTIILIETWENMSALRAHLKAPHMVTFRESAKPFVQHLRHQVLQPALDA